MGSDGLGSVPRGLEGTSSGNRVPETRGIKKVPGSVDSVLKGFKSQGGYGYG